MKFSISEFTFNKQRGFSVFGKRFSTRAEAVTYGEECVRLREIVAGRELTRAELIEGIATEDRPSRERVEIVSQNQSGYGGTKPKAAPATNAPNPNALAWAEDALIKAKFNGAMSDVAAAQDALARVKSGGDPIRPEHVFMLPGDKVSRMSDGEIRILRKRDTYDAVIHTWPAAEAPAEIKTLIESNTQ